MAEQRRYAVVTTCHAGGWLDHGRRMVDTFLRHWPADVPLLLYHEGFDPPVLPGRIESHDLIPVSPALAAFKQRHADNPRAHGLQKPWRRLRLGAWSLPVPLKNNSACYRWDAVRFAHKMHAIFDAARRCGADALIWIDADTLFFADVSRKELDMLAPPGSALSCLRRSGSHTECGFVVYNLRHAETLRLLADFEELYARDLLFAEREFHDSYLFDVLRRRAEVRGARVHDIAEGGGTRAAHVLVNSRLGCFMDHLKGDRKAEGRSRDADLVTARTEPYWQKDSP